MLQPRLNVKVSQRQVLTPGLVQMVSVLALNKLELKDMLNEEMVENPVLEEIEPAEESLEERSAREGDRERSAEDMASEGERSEKDPFDEVDFGSYFHDYLDPGFRTGGSFEEYEKPGFEHFLAQPSKLSDHLLWQLGSLHVNEDMLILEILGRDGREVPAGTSGELVLTSLTLGAMPLIRYRTGDIAARIAAPCACVGR